VALTTSTLTSPLESPSTTAAPPFSDPATVSELNPIVEAPGPASLDETMQQQAVDTAPPTLPPPPPEPTVAEEIAATEVVQEEEEEEEMLLDIVDNANNAHIGGDEPLAPVVPEVPIEPVQELEELAPEAIAPEIEEIPVEQKEDPTPVEPTVVEVVQAEAPKPVEDDDDDFPDLLGGLEKQLNEPVSQVPPPVDPVGEVLQEKATESTANDEKPAEVVEEKMTEA